MGEFGDEIEDAALTLEVIPPRDATWQQIQEFALTFDGYEQLGSLDAVAEVANSRRRETLKDLRTCLFFEQRRWRHFGLEPTGEDLVYIRSLVQGIRDHVKNQRTV